MSTFWEERRKTTPINFDTKYSIIIYIGFDEKIK